MPQPLENESIDAYTDRLTGADKTGRRPYKDDRGRQCSIGYHDECLSPEECECPCHHVCQDPIHDLAEQGPALKIERDEARALVLKLFRRGCIVERAPDRYDHVYSATYQEAQAALIAWGSVKREECVRE